MKVSTHSPELNLVSPVASHADLSEQKFAPRFSPSQKLDRELILRIQQGDESATIALGDRYQERIGNLLLRSCVLRPRREELKEAGRRGLIHAAKQFDLESDKRFSTLAGRAIRMEIFRAKQIHISGSKETVAEGKKVVDLVNLDGRTELVRQQQKSALSKAMRQLTPQHIQVINELFGEDSVGSVRSDLKTTAEILGLTVNQVKEVLAEALRFMRTEVGKLNSPVVRKMPETNTLESEESPSGIVLFQGPNASSDEKRLPLRSEVENGASVWDIVRFSPSANSTGKGSSHDFRNNLRIVPNPADAALTEKYKRRAALPPHLRFVD